MIGEIVRYIIGKIVRYIIILEFEVIKVEN